MVTLKMQLSLYPYLISIYFIELDVLSIPKSQVCYAVNGDTFCLLLQCIYSLSFGNRFLQM
jgi:hypothetical protein